MTKFALLDGENKIVDISSVKFPAHEELRWVEAPSDAINSPDWFYDGNDNTVKKVPVPTLTLEELKNLYLGEVQTYIDSVAGTKGYDSGISCASYFNDPHPPFKDDAQAFVPWRSGVWLQCYADFAAIEAGTKPLPSNPAEYIASISPAKPTGW